MAFDGLSLFIVLLFLRGCITHLLAAIFGPSAPQRYHVPNDGTGASQALVHSSSVEANYDQAMAL